MMRSFFKLQQFDQKQKLKAVLYERSRLGAFDGVLRSDHDRAERTRLDKEIREHAGEVATVRRHISGVFFR